MRDWEEDIPDPGIPEIAIKSLLSAGRDWYFAAGGLAWLTWKRG